MAMLIADEAVNEVAREAFFDEARLAHEACLLPPADDKE
jgi:hypothetical protein